MLSNIYTHLFEAGIFKSFSSNLDPMGGYSPGLYHTCGHELTKSWGAGCKKSEKEYPPGVQTLAKIALFVHVFRHFGYFCALNFLFKYKIVENNAFV